MPRGAKPPSEKAKRGANLPSEMAYCGHASERRSLKRSLEIAEAGAVSLGGSVVASHSQVGTHGSIPPHSTIRQRINCRGAIFCARPSMPPPPGCIPLSEFIHQLVQGSSILTHPPTRWCIPSWQRLHHSHTLTCQLRHSRQFSKP